MRATTVPRIRGVIVNHPPGPEDRPDKVREAGRREEEPVKIADIVHVPAGYRDAFNAVDRAWFIPPRMWVRENFSHGNDDDTDDDIAVDRDTDPELWERATYTDVPIVTQWDDGQTVWPDIGYLPTCSASAPSVVGTMLAALDPRPGDTVLEIGSGTGYNAAVLSEIVGDTGRVVTVEIDAALAGDARARLTRYPNVEVVTADGTGTPIGGEWDRVIATASVPPRTDTVLVGRPHSPRRRDPRPDAHRLEQRPAGAVRRR